MILQQTEQGSSSRAPSALHRPAAVELSAVQSTRPRPYYPINPPPAQSDWASAPLPAPLRTPRLVPAQWPALAPAHVPTPVRAPAPARAPQREPARWGPEPVAQPAPAHAYTHAHAHAHAHAYAHAHTHAPTPALTPRPVVSSTSIKNAESELAQWEHDDVVALQRIVEVRKLKRGVDEATATISAEVDRLTALRLAIERHVLARLKADRALLGQATWVPDAGYLESEYLQELNVYDCGR
ncbi:hypothetical protein B0H21DRAFT_109440 [Amylocystis lapponica]|nr:hypothetical protein B0H21DRAFT_109440 [Amylocystis lapponica]